MFLVISTSRSPKSRSRVLAGHVRELYRSLHEEAEWIDLASMSLPRCDADSCYADPDAQLVAEKIKQAKGIVLATPIYNYSYCSEAKNLIELTGQNWKDSVVGFLCAAGGQGSYMSIMHLANSLMLDFRTFVLPRFVYATGDAFAGNQITDNDLTDRLLEFTQEHARVTRSLLINSAPL